MTKVLIVDEAELFLKLERSFLRRSGFDLLVASSPEDLLLKARRDQPDLVLLHSKGHHGHCGVPCARRLKGDPETCRIPVVLIRAGALDLSELSPPCERILDSPLDPHELLDAISALVPVRHRIQPRIPLSLPVEIRAGRSSLRAHTKDISAGGLFVLTRRLLDNGVPVRIHVTLPAPEGASVITFQGVVVRRVADDPASYLIPGNAVRLLEEDESGRRALEDFLDRQGAAP